MTTITGATSTMPRKMGFPSYFYCTECRAWTHVDPSPAQEADPICVQCGESYKCGECGYEIDRAGNCQRPEEDAEGNNTLCPSLKEQ